MISRLPMSLFLKVNRLSFPPCHLLIRTIMFQGLADLCLQSGEGHAIFLNFALQLGQVPSSDLVMCRVKSLTLAEIQPLRRAATFTQKCWDSPYCFVPRNKGIERRNGHISLDNRLRSRFIHLGENYTVKWA